MLPSITAATAAATTVIATPTAEEDEQALICITVFHDDLWQLLYTK